MTLKFTFLDENDDIITKELEIDLIGNKREIK